IYNSGFYLLELTFSFAFAYSLLYGGRHARTASLVAAVSAVALALSLTRALYIGTVSALVLSLAIWGIGQGSAHRLLRRRIIVTAAAAAIFGAGLLVTVPGALTSGPLHSVIARASTSTSEFASSDVSTSTF